MAWQALYSNCEVCYFASGLGGGCLLAAGKSGCCKSQAEARSFSLNMLNSADQTSAKELEENFCSSIFML